MSSGSGTGTPITAATPISGWYCTLADLKQRLQDANTYTAATISFASSGNIITDTAKGLARFLSSKRIKISGTDSNNGYFNITSSGGGAAATITTTENLTTEAAGDTVTITDVTDPTDDNQLESIIEAVSRAIDAQCDRFFYLTESQARYYSTEWSDWLLCDDIVAVTSLKTDADGDRTYETTWATTDYDLEPYNAARQNWPYTSIRPSPNGSYRFPYIRKGIEITATFGWPEVPQQITEACLLQSMRLWKRKDAVFGVIGAAEMGQMQVIPKLDPDVQLLLKSFRKLV